LFFDKWPANYPSLSTQYLLSLAPSVTSNLLSSIYTGIDVWGRGSHGGGGFGSYKALEHITSTSPPGQSTALFGQAWTWETQQDTPGFTWDSWWAYERKLWVGLGSATANRGVEVPKAPRRKGPNGEEEEPECPHGSFRPLVEFFERQVPPDPWLLPVWMCFCPGVGMGWWVGGVRVLKDADGWTDLDKQSSIGDLVWPVPELRLEGRGEWEGEGEGNMDDDKDLPKVKSEICMSKAWNGGSSLRLQLCSPSPVPAPDTVSEDAVYRTFWLPVQSIGLTRGKTYEATLVYKVESQRHSNLNVDVDIGLSVKPLSAADPAKLKITPLSTSDSQKPLPGGWTKLSIAFIVKEDPQVVPAITGALGLNIVILAETFAHWHALDVSLLLGQLCVYPARPADAEAHEPMILWADVTLQHPSSPGKKPLGGTITWETAVAFPDTPNSIITSTEDPVSVFKVPPPTQEYPWFPSFVYFNIYALAHPVNGVVGHPEESVWIGTSGGTAEGRKCAFVVVWKSLRGVLGLGDGGVGKGKVRFYVQGVTDRGVVLGWERCVYVDVDVDWDV
jgi:mannosyl-glycoprotein endo-beta-N-acetylglucosaminidase